VAGKLLNEEVSLHERIISLNTEVLRYRGYSVIDKITIAMCSVSTDEDELIETETTSLSFKASRSS